MDLPLVDQCEDVNVKDTIEKKIWWKENLAIIIATLGLVFTFIQGYRSVITENQNIKDRVSALEYIQSQGTDDKLQNKIDDIRDKLDIQSDRISRVEGQLSK